MLNNLKDIASTSLHLMKKILLKAEAGGISRGKLKKA